MADGVVHDAEGGQVVHNLVVGSPEEVLGRVLTPGIPVAELELEPGLGLLGRPMGGSPVPRRRWEDRLPAVPVLDLAPEGGILAGLVRTL